MLQCPQWRLTKSLHFQPQSLSLSLSHCLASHLSCFPCGLLYQPLNWSLSQFPRVDLSLAVTLGVSAIRCPWVPLKQPHQSPTRTPNVPMPSASNGTVQWGGVGRWPFAVLGCCGVLFFSIAYHHNRIYAFLPLSGWRAFS